jgi:hypothetical protein
VGGQKSASGGIGLALNGEALMSTIKKSIIHANNFLVTFCFGTKSNKRNHSVRQCNLKAMFIRANLVNQ